MVRNLLENAIVHGQGRICRVGEIFSDLGSSQKVLITVTDEGPGVAPGLADVVFDRFSKGSPDTVGHGLGLAIVREVALGHEGTVEFIAGPTCLARISLPMASRIGR
jgi:signal transduction histidine kinase